MHQGNQPTEKIPKNKEKDSVCQIRKSMDLPCLGCNYYLRCFPEKAKQEPKNDLSLEVTRSEANALKKYLEKQNIEYESSGAYDLVHFELSVTKKQENKINDFLQQLSEN